ncbi:MAG: TatD family hydrolase [Ketobacteraceae bacterium]|nr:TatD family hydrolase [Ketobacteraceae bacterium]
MKWIDSHCHLDFEVFSDQRADIIRRAGELGIEKIVIPGVMAEHWERIRSICREWPSVLVSSYGLHPCFLESHEEAHLEQLDQWLGEHRPAAVGEIGLDFFIEDYDEDRQMHFFREQVRLAKPHKLPILVHCRKGQDLCLKVFRELNYDQGGFMHAYSGSLQQAERCLEFGFKLGIGGAATYERSRKLHRIIRKLPLDSFVMETDAPDIPPCFARDEPNTPLNIPKIAGYICEHTGREVAELAQATTENVREQLKLAR